MVSFFAPLSANAIKEELKQPFVPGEITPLHVFDFLNYHAQKGIDLWLKKTHVDVLIRRLVSAQILSSWGGSGSVERFFCTIELSNLQKQGWLWLGKALGIPYIALELAKDLALIVGKNKHGDIAVGTGLLISPNEVLTCGHVVEDLSTILEIKVGGSVAVLERVASHPQIDVGIIYLKGNLLRKLPDMAFREAVILEEVLIVGYPSVPGSLEPTLTFHRGEISGRLSQTQVSWPMDLFSAIARPGNSGGPVVAMDGRVLGIVTRSLERQRETADSMAPMPFFASVPSTVIASALVDLTGRSDNLPWEDWS